MQYEGLLQEIIDNEIRENDLKNQKIIRQYQEELNEYKKRNLELEKQIKELKE